MRKINILLSLTFIIIGISEAYGLNDNVTINDSIKDVDVYEKLADEQFKAYEDSLLKVLYPEVRECHYQESSISDLLPVQSTTNVNADCDSEIYNPILPNSVNIDRTKSVGEIEIKSGMTPTGAKTYEVPIKVYPGINGFQPNISLVYNSQSNNSIVGQGWSISGIPIIERRGKNPFHDNMREGILMDNSDSFYLDGTRLVKTDTSTSGTIIYESEQGNIKVAGYVSDSILKYFKVFYPDGSTALFGYSSNLENRLYYPITSVSDIHGNTVTYTYNIEDNYYYISKIEYNKASIEFAYQKRTDVITNFTCSKYTYIRKCLASINSLNSGQILGTYTLTHNLHNNLSHLSSIAYSSDQDSFNPIQFIYGNGCTIEDYKKNTTQLRNWYESDDKKMIKVVKGRFDYGSTNDGLIVLPNYNPFWHKYQHKTFFRKETNQLENIYQGNERIFLYTGLSDDLANPMPDLVTENGFIDILCADLAGKQEEYVIKVNNYYSTHDRIKFTVYKPNLYNGLQLLYTRSYISAQTDFSDDKGVYSVQPKFFYTGDFNGDGKMEVLSVGMNSPCKTSIPTKCYLFDLENNRILYEGKTFDFNMVLMGTDVTDSNYASNNSDKLLVFDADGDGKTDICHIHATGCSTYTFDIADDGSMNLRLLASDSFPNRSKLMDKDLYLGEFNGDGLIDIVVSSKRGDDRTENNWMVYYSCGNGTFMSSISSGPVKPAEDGTGFIMQDVDCDGRTDIIKYDDSGFDTYPSMPGYPCSIGFRTPFDSDNSIIVPTDINSHNTFSKVLSLHKGVVTKYSFTKNKSHEQLLTGMINSLGVIEKNEYRSLCESPIDNGFYTYTFEDAYPYITLREPLMVLVRTETVLDGKIYDKSSYDYENAVLHRMGLGFRGFEKIISTDNQEKTTICNYDPYNHSVLKSVISPSLETYTNYSIDIKSGGIKNILVDTKTEKNRLTGYTANWSYTYDQYGFPLTETVSYSDGIKIKKETIYDHKTDINDKYSIGFATDVRVTTTRGSNQYEERVHYPDFEYRRPNVAVKYVNDNQVEHTDYTYDSQGKVLDKTVKYYESIHGLTDTYAYTIDGLLSKEFDPLGCSRVYTYDMFGRISGITDHTGTINIEYDSFGREKSTYNPDGTVRTFDYSWETTDNGGIYSITETSTGKPTEKKYYDALNREVRAEQTRFDGSILKTDKEYDYKGNLIAESMPYKSESPTKWTTFDYDSYDRLIYRTEATGKRTSYDYSGSSVTEDDGIMQKIKDYNSAGELLSVSDSEGTVYFELCADGQKQRVVIDDGYGTYNLNTIYTYDKYRRLISVEDPSQGETVTSYDEEGNISSRTDANGNRTEFEYDCFGRLIKKIFPEFATTYTYNDYNELISQNSSNGTYKTFTYDDLGRLISEKDAGGGAWLQKDYTYADGNVATIAYTSNRGKLTTEYYTYTNGHLTEVKISDGQSIYKLEEENELGKPTRAVTGNVTRNYGYDEYGFPRFRAAASEDTEYQDEEYEFDTSRSNLYSRYDIQRGQWESFEYDTQNRLINYDGEYVSYDTNGNISEKSDVGSYQYDNGAKPYAVTGVTPYTEPDKSLSKEQNIEYASFSRPSRITENGYTARFEYNADGERVKMTIAGSTQFDRLERTYLGGCYECDDDGVTANGFLEKLYLMGDYYSAPSVLFSGRIMEQQKYDSIPKMKGDSLISGIIDPIDPIFPINPLGLDSDLTSIRLGYFTRGKAHVYGVHQILRDYLGSITHVIKPDGTEAESLSYDAWGRVRLSDEGNRYLTTDDPPLYLGRGYTGHEHLPLFGLINMNARLYDPLLGRFLSPDPYIAFSDWLQSYNRYSYVLNNPFKYVDQNGEFFWVAVGVGALVGATINVILHWNEIKEGGFVKGLEYFGVGAVAGAIGSAAGIGVAVGFSEMLGVTAASYTAATTGFINGAAAGAASGASSGFVLGTGNSLIEGKDFGDSLVDGLWEAGTDGLFGGVGGGLSGGFQAFNEGKNFWTGTNPTPKSIFPTDIPLPPNEYYKPGNYSLYFGYDKNTYDINYIGITRRNPWERWLEHLRSSSPRSGLGYDLIPGVPKGDLLYARICEQYYLNQFGMRKIGGTLFNMRNEISPKYWKKYGL